MSDLLDKAARVIAACEGALAVCMNRTPGEWQKAHHDFETTRIYGRVSKLVCEVPAPRPAEYSDDSRFIALASRMTEPALRSTVIALRMLVEAIDYRAPFNATEIGNLTAMLAEWPDTI
jgi:hypothetical protein